MDETDIGYWHAAYDKENLTLYVSIHQLFHLFILPRFIFSPASVSLVTVLQLLPATAGGKKRYLIRSQNDLYQVNEYLKFVSLFGVLSVMVMAFQLVATGLCVLGAVAGWPISWVEENVVGGNRERGLVDVVKG